MFRLNKSKHVSFVAWFLIFLGLAGCLITSVLYINEPRPPSESNNIKSIAITTSPSSIKPSAKSIDNYTVAPTLPKYISIPNINISDSRVIQLGLMSSGQIATPDNIYDTGWYMSSAKPGQLGAMFIFGHVSSWTADGVFYNLKNLRPGNDITITQGNNKTYVYQVAKSIVYSYTNVNMKTVLSPVNPSKPGLNLMTCTGQVIKGTSEFNERLVVFSSLVRG